MTHLLLLIAPSGSGTIDAGVLTIVRGLIQAEPVWLAEAEACEFVLGLPPADLEDRLRADLHPRPIDIAIIPKENRRKRLLLADMDSTMIGQECIDELGTEAGVGAQIAAITEKAMRGELDFEQALRERVAFIKGLPVSTIDKLISDRITFTAGGRALVSTMRAYGAWTALVSGGFLPFTTHVAAVCGFHEHRGNDLVIEKGFLMGLVREPILGRAAKIEAFNELIQRLAIAANDALTVGDGANDIDMLQAAGLGVAFHAKPKVREAAAVRIDHADLTALLYLQGYRKEEFCT